MVARSFVSVVLRSAMGKLLAIRCGYGPGSGWVGTSPRLPSCERAHPRMSCHSRTPYCPSLGTRCACVSEALAGLRKKVVT